MNFFTRLECLLDCAEKLARDLHYGLSWKFVNYDCKMFYNIGPRSQKQTFADYYNK